MAKEFSFPIFPIDLFVKGTYYVVKFYADITDYAGVATGYWSETFLLDLSKKTLLLQSFLKSLLVITYLPYLPNFSIKALILLVLLACKVSKFTFNATFYMELCMGTCLKSRRAVVFNTVIRATNSSH